MVPAVFKRMAERLARWRRARTLRDIVEKRGDRTPILRHVGKACDVRLGNIPGECVDSFVLPDIENGEFCNTMVATVYVTTDDPEAVRWAVSREARPGSITMSGRLRSVRYVFSGMKVERVSFKDASPLFGIISADLSLVFDSCLVEFLDEPRHDGIDAGAPGEG